MKKPRTDKRKNIGKVAEVLAENPNLTAREIADETWIWVSTANRSRQELAQTGTKDETIAYIVTSAKNRLQEISKILDHKTKKTIQKVENDEEIDNRDVALLKEIAKDDLARITVLWWAVTDDKWWLKEQITIFNLPTNTR